VRPTGSETGSPATIQGSTVRKNLLTSAATQVGAHDRDVGMSYEQEAIEKQKLEKSLNRKFYLPRLSPAAYQSYAVVHWTLTIEHRASGWLSPPFHALFRELMLHAQVREQLICPVYCLMPNHIHLVWMGHGEASDQRNGMAFLRTHLEPLIAPAKFQHQAHDHVLREDERKQLVFVNACSYIASNPVEAGLVPSAEDWEFTGAIVGGYPDLHPVRQRKFWEILWGLYWKRRRGEEI
jgi:putative transposase